MDAFIKALRESDEYIQHIYLQGGCYQFHLMLCKLFDGCEPYISNKRDHVVTKWNGKLYDINGLVYNNDAYLPLKDEDLALVTQWSFAENNLLKITECPYCEEALVYGDLR